MTSKHAQHHQPHTPRRPLAASAQSVTSLYLSGGLRLEPDGLAPALGRLTSLRDLALSAWSLPNGDADAEFPPPFSSSDSVAMRGSQSEVQSVHARGERSMVKRGGREPRPLHQVTRFEMSCFPVVAQRPAGRPWSS